MAGLEVLVVLGVLQVVAVVHELWALFEGHFPVFLWSREPFEFFFGLKRGHILEE